MIANRNNIKMAFAKGSSSVFVVESPLQLMCAIEAMAEFEVADYKLILNFNHINDPRNKQTVSLAEHWGVTYEIVYRQDVEDNYNIIGKGRYQRAFIGNWYDYKMLLVAARYLTNQSVIAFLDDGTASIAILTGTMRDFVPTGIRKKIRYYLKYYRNKILYRGCSHIHVYKRLSAAGINCTSAYFTLYYDIRTCLFTLYPNKFKHMIEKVQSKKLNREYVVLIIGTFIEKYAIQNGISTSELEMITTEKLREVKLKHPEMPIIYVPHGRDENAAIHDKCTTLGIKYLKIDTALEFYILESSMNPIYLYAFNSTALLNLKRLYPDVKAINWFIDKKKNNPYYSFFNKVRKYYEKNGIRTDIINYCK